MTISQETINRFIQSDSLCVDIETKDPLLLEQGPGTHRGDGHICGVGFSTVDNGVETQAYLSLTHPDTSLEDREVNRRIVKDIAASNNRKLGANIAYDAEWLEFEGMPLGGKLDDVQFAEPLLNEYRRSYSLDNLAKTYDLEAKKSNILNDYADKMNWKAPKGQKEKARGVANIWRMPEAVAREYCYQDLTLPHQIFEKQTRMMETQNLLDLYELETDLIPVMLTMRRNGVKIDMDLLQKLSMQSAERHFVLAEEIYDWAGREFNIGSSVQLAKILDRKKIPYPRKEPTAKMKEKGKTQGNPNLDKAALKIIGEKRPMIKKILEYRHFTTLTNLFLHKYAMFEVNGRLYGSFHPLRSDKYGTVSGRFSASKPNLQQVSAKEEEMLDDDYDELTGAIVRRLFIPEEGKRWAKLDYSQVEYRLLAHFATGWRKGDKVSMLAEQLRESYRANKGMDYHQRVMDSTGFDRRTAKNLNFGGVYGIGATTASKLFGWSLEDAEIFLAGYHKSSPYIKATRKRVSDVVASRGHLFTLLGRRARMHHTRKLHSFFNRLIQGSAADVMKKAMVDAHKAGLFDILDLHITVHDELDVSYGDSKIELEALEELKHVMEETVKLDVPLLVDCHTGNNWAEAD